MSELAFNSNGDTFDVPATVSGWRVRRMKPRGAPELVYGRDGRPLTVPVESDVDDLREAVDTPGKYRLDPINDDGKCVEGVPPAYVQVVKPIETGTALAASTTSDDAIREAMRLNTELAKSVIDRFPEMMTAAAELLRAADGAGLPARQPRKTGDDEEHEDDDDNEPAAPASSPAFELINTLVAQVVPLVVTGLANKKMPKLGAIFDWRKAVPEAIAGDVATDSIADHSSPAKSQTELPPLDPKAMSHFITIQSALPPAEAALARQVAAELTPGEMRAWFAELSALSVPDAVARIRTFIGATPKAGAAS